MQLSGWLAKTMCAMLEHENFSTFTIFCTKIDMPPTQNPKTKQIIAARMFQCRVANEDYLDVPTFLLTMGAPQNCNDRVVSATSKPVEGSSRPETDSRWAKAELLYLLFLSPGEQGDKWTANRRQWTCSEVKWGKQNLQSHQLWGTSFHHWNLPCRQKLFFTGDIHRFFIVGVVRSWVQMPHHCPLGRRVRCLMNFRINQMIYDTYDTYWYIWYIVYDIWHMLHMTYDTL